MGDGRWGQGVPSHASLCESHHVAPSVALDHSWAASAGYSEGESIGSGRSVTVSAG